MKQPITDAPAHTGPWDKAIEEEQEGRRINDSTIDTGKLQAVRRAVRPSVSAATTDSAAPSEPTVSTDSVLPRLARLERQNLLMKVLVGFLVLLSGFLVADKFVPTSAIVRQTLVESKQLKLMDSDGNPRLFLRMYSRVPVLQLLDRNGKPRMSLGMRFDDTPFIDLSDKTGKTRATFEMTAEDNPTLVLFDKDGESTFQIK